MGRVTRTSASQKHEVIRPVEEPALPVKQTLVEIGLPRSTFHLRHAQYQRNGLDGLADRSSQPRQFWNRIRQAVRTQVVQIALERRDFRRGSWPGTSPTHRHSAV